MKFFKGLSVFLLVCCTVVFLLVGVAYRQVPDEFTQTSYSALAMNKVLRLSPDRQAARDAQSCDINVSILDVIPVKKSVLRLGERKYVVPGGNVVGLKLYTKGVIVVGMDEIDGQSGRVAPAKSAGIEKGDSIICIDGMSITSSAQVAEIFSGSEGKQLSLVCERNGKEYTTVFSTVKSVTDGHYKAGLWIRDSAAGIGTMTYLDTDNGIFASLGHAVCDIDTGKTVNVARGECVCARITGCNKGVCGQAGELCGIFSPGSFGSVVLNCESGTYGKLDGEYSDADKLPVAYSQEVKTGYAQILSTVDGEGTQRFDVEITRLYAPSGDENKCMSIRVTDSRLLEKTGGIVQGMSGSPIIQNGMLVGAVTHVFVNDPTQGYGIYAEKMLSCSQTAADVLQNAA